MKSDNPLTGIVVITLLGLAASIAAADDEVVDFAAEYTALENATSEDGQAWYVFAREARLAGEYDLARDALAKAEALDFVPARIGVERTRIAVVTGDAAQAEAELQKLLDSGFTYVQVLTNDADINSLAGRDKYDTIVAEMSVKAYPCEHQDGFRDFDFWMGEWVVHVAGGQLAGYNSITSVERGCLILENWTSASGGSGRSINYLDKATGKWVQIWNDSSGNQIDFRGGMTEDGMLLVGQTHNVANGTTQPYRGLWTLLEDGRVRQFFEQSDDGGKTWTTSFEGFYTRIEDKDLK